MITTKVKVEDIDIFMDELAGFRALVRKNENDWRDDEAMRRIVMSFADKLEPGS